MNTNDEQQPDRTLVHTRQIICEAWLRRDGRYDIEGRMTDAKTHEAVLPFKTVRTGAFYHDMRLVMTIDANMTIQRVEARSEHAPTPYCREINAAYSALTGLTIGPGFKAQVKARVGGNRGCTHLTDLLGPMATAAIQATLGRLQTAEYLAAVAAPGDTLDRPWVVDTCHAYRMDGEAVKVIWPEHKRLRATVPGRDADSV
jgi:Protein of unknown function (DUF2889)